MVNFFVFESHKICNLNLSTQLQSELDGSGESTAGGVDFGVGVLDEEAMIFESLDDL